MRRRKSRVINAEGRRRSRRAGIFAARPQAISTGISPETKSGGWRYLQPLSAASEMLRLMLIGFVTAPNASTWEADAWASMLYRIIKRKKAAQQSA